MSNLLSVRLSVRPSVKCVHCDKTKAASEKKFNYEHCTTYVACVLCMDLTMNRCSSDCSCHGEWYEPICGDDGLTYFSPCYAGCLNLLADTVGFYSGSALLAMLEPLY